MTQKKPVVRSDLNARKRRSMVEKVIRERGWSESIVSELIRATGASRRTLYRDRDEIAAELASEEIANLEQRRALFLQEVRRVRDSATEVGQFNPAARLLDMEAKVLGLDRIPLPDVEPEASSELDTSLEAVLADVRKLRRRAVAGDSYVAAEKLLAKEVDLVEAIRLRDEAARATELAHLDERGIVELIIENAERLPASLRQRLLEAISDTAA